MGNVFDEKIFNDAKKFILDNMKAGENVKFKINKPDTLIHKHSKVFSINQTEKQKFMKDHGVDAKVLDTANKVDQAWRAACAEIGKDQLVDASANALKDDAFKKAGGMKYMSVAIKTALPDGKETIVVNAYDENRNPHQPETVVKSYGRITVNRKVTRPFPENIADNISASIEKTIRGKF